MTTESLSVRAAPSQGRKGFDRRISGLSENSLRQPAYLQIRIAGEGITADEMAEYVCLRPKIEAEIKFSEWMAGRLLGHAEFGELREM